MARSRKAVLLNTPCGETAGTLATVSFFLYILVLIGTIGYSIFIIFDFGEIVAVYGSWSLAVPITLLIASTLGIVGASIGLASLRSTSTTLASVTYFLLVILMVVGVTTIVLTFEEDKRILAELDDEFSGPSLDDDWSDLQNTFECCGHYNSSDWTRSGFIIPESCCPGGCSNGTVYPDGCRAVVDAEIEKQYTVAFWISITDQVVFMMILISMIVLKS